MPSRVSSSVPSTIFPGLDFIDSYDRRSTSGLLSTMKALIHLLRSSNFSWLLTTQVRSWLFTVTGIADMVKFSVVVRVGSAQVREEYRTIASSDMLGFSSSIA